MPSFHPHLTTATGYSQLGMWEDAWDELEKLAPEDRAHPDVLQLPLGIFIGLKRRLHSPMPVEPDDLRHLTAAQGYVELGMHLDANEELEHIILSPGFRKFTGSV